MSISRVMSDRATSRSRVVAGRSQRRARRRRRNLSALVTAIILSVLIVVALVVFRPSDGTSRHGSQVPTGLRVVPTTYSMLPSSTVFQPIGSRARDNRPLSAGEVFTGDAKRLSFRGFALQLRHSRVDSDCGAAMWGERLVAALRAAGCSQLIRGLYVATGGRHVGQFALLNLRDAAAATRVVQLPRTEPGVGWMVTLAPDKPYLLSGYSEGGGYVLGHFAAFIWLARADGAPPTKRDDFAALSIALRGAEKAVFRRVLQATRPFGDAGP